MLSQHTQLWNSCNFFSQASYLRPSLTKSSALAFFFAFLRPFETSRFERPEEGTRPLLRHETPGSSIGEEWTPEDLAHRGTYFNEDALRRSFFGNTSIRYHWLLGTDRVEQAEDEEEITLRAAVGTCRRFCKVRLHPGCSAFCLKRRHHTCAHVCPPCLSKLQQRASQGVARRDGQWIIDDRKGDLACYAFWHTKFGIINDKASSPSIQ